MKRVICSNFIDIDKSSLTPAYLQIARAIKKAIETGGIRKGDTMPSLSKLCEELQVPRYAGEHGYKYLKQIGILKTWPGKGYFVEETTTNPQIRIFLLINKLSEYKKVFYDHFVETLGQGVLINLCVYDNDFVLFEKLIRKAGSEYSHYVIMAHFNDRYVNEYPLINNLPKHKLILLDRKIEGIKGNYGGVYENFKADIYQSLQKLLELLCKFHTLKLLVPSRNYYPEQLIEGFTVFCQEYAFERDVLIDADPIEIKKGEVFICLKDSQLISVIENMKSLGLEAGKDIGIISYNETPLKQYILKGITTISTDFKQMGVEAANMILHNYRNQIELECHVNLRSSL